jgi:hypothetical protein
MGFYLNPTNDLFRMAVNSDPYVDKSGLIAELNKLIDTNNRFVCVSRPRRFGKTIAANMLNAYYNRECDSSAMFAGSAISEDPLFREHLGGYNVIFLNMVEFLSQTEAVDGMINMIENELTGDFTKAYPEIPRESGMTFVKYLNAVYAATKIGNIIIIDEWDCIFREHKHDTVAQKKYLDFLRLFLKDQVYVSLAYMTGILPIKKYGAHSALSMFGEYSMTSPRQFDRFIGFTSEEVREICDRSGMDYAEMSAWYNGYRFPNAPAVFNPRSVVETVLGRTYSNYWARTETYEALRIYIDMEFDGLRESIIRMLSGETVKIKTNKFTNDMVTFQNKDDVLTLLVHLGYLGFLIKSSEVFIPNREIYDEFVTSIDSPKWGSVIDALNMSEELLNATWNKDACAVADYIDAAHDETSYLNYSDEDALAYTVSLAYYTARRYYTIVREMPFGKGFADMLFLPRPNHADKPAMVIELKWDKSAAGAIEQIKDKHYPTVLEGYTGGILLVGINYKKRTKEHTCLIEEYDCSAL